MKVKSPSLLFNSESWLMAPCSVARQTGVAALSRGLMAMILSPRRLFLFATLIFTLCVGIENSWGQSPCTNPVAVRPILFVPGINESSDAWGTETRWTNPGSPGVRDHVMSDLEQLPGYHNPLNYDLYYDGNVVRYSQSPSASAADPIASNLNIPCNARFFSIRFFGWSSGLSNAFDGHTVANVSIVTKAYELSQVLQFITSLTYVQDVVVVAHSMGALDSRAYMEGLGSSKAPCTAIPCNIASSPLPYTGEIGMLITLDGANAGSDLASLATHLSLLPFLYPIIGTTNVQELVPYDANHPGESIIGALNYLDPYLDAAGTPVYANDLQSSVVAIISTFREEEHQPCLLSTSSTCGSDNVVSSDSQSIETPLLSHPLPPAATPKDLPNTYSSSDVTISGALSNCAAAVLDATNVYPELHSLACLGEEHPSEDQLPASIIYSTIIPNVQSQLTQINVVTTDTSGQPYTGTISLTLQNDVSSLAAITDPQAKLTGSSAPVSTAHPYSLVYNSGGPSGAGTPTITALDASGHVCSPCYIEPGNWSLTFNVSFDVGTVSKPSATTTSATNLQGDGASLVGTVNPNGGATTVWFEWGSTTALGNSTSKHLIAAGTSAVPYSASVSGLSSNNTYYYRIDASNSAGIAYGSIVPFYTLSTLPSPNLLSPLSGATNTSATPQFSWTAVSSATSYRIMVATTAAALPTDPTSSACGVGCVINDTPAGTSYTPPAGVLSAGTQYFWQVHARSPLQYGAWSSVSNFTPGQPSTSTSLITGEWVWMGGSNTTSAVDNSVYGTVGVPAPTNVPGVRLGASSWTDSSGNLWLFGGCNISGCSYGGRNDLWEFNPTTNEWTSISVNQAGVYGTLGVPNAANVPPARWGATSWTDVNGTLWLFGGYDYYNPGGYTDSLLSKIA